MSSLDDLFTHLRAAAASHGDAWVQEQVRGVLGIGSGVQADPLPGLRRGSRRSRAPERLSPEPTPRSRRRCLSPVRSSREMAGTVCGGTSSAASRGTVSGRRAEDAGGGAAAGPSAPSPLCGPGGGAAVPEVGVSGRRSSRKGTRSERGTAGAAGPPVMAAAVSSSARREARQSGGGEAGPALSSAGSGSRQRSGARSAEERRPGGSRDTAGSPSLSAAQQRTAQQQSSGSAGEARARRSSVSVSLPVREDGLAGGRQDPECYSERAPPGGRSRHGRSGTAVGEYSPSDSSLSDCAADAEEELANPERRAAGEAVILRREPGADLAGPSTALDDRSAAGGSRERTPRPAAAGASASGQPGRDPCLVWIFGHSYVRRGAIRAAVRRDGRQLGFSRDLAVLRWIGIGGMLWCGVLPEVQFNASLDRHPDILVVHAGGNDLGLRSSREIIRDIKLDILRLKSTFPGLLFVWSDMVARRVWRHARSVDRLNKARVKLNKEGIALGDIALSFTKVSNRLSVSMSHDSDIDDTLSIPETLSRASDRGCVSS
ncbi:collagen alpha-2(I) chain-like [Hyla sarda]|uniref:collagen alpha-2(I) chain-like n=1 Tax=Hyla sarda TaxID=327740 RepID=UPI0024C3B71F|nr:collagen alpha-2(I) chain-like [Hyla sarda]